MDQREHRARPRSRRRKRRRSGKGLFSALTTCFLLLLCIAGLQKGLTIQEAPPEKQTVSRQDVSDLALSTAASLPWPEPADSSDPDSWNLILVNPWNPLPEGYAVSLTELKNGLRVDTRCYPDLQAMLAACRRAGLSPVICSAYRTQEDQERLFRSKVSRLTAQGYAQADAEAEAGKSVAVPGTSEHQLGLAVDLVDLNNQQLDESQEDTAVQKWLMEHCWEYGFILRYPSDKSEMTGITYEPWHYRYVGREDAEQIHSLGVCLEEYLERIP